METICYACSNVCMVMYLYGCMQAFFPVSVQMYVCVCIVSVNMSLCVCVSMVT